MAEQARTAPAAEAAMPKAKAGGRAIALDALKGLIMIVMALDHTHSFLMKYDGVKEIWYEKAIYNPDVWDFAARIMVDASRAIVHLEPGAHRYALGLTVMPK